MTLKELRLKKNLTLIQVANALGYTYPSSYRKIEEGDQELKVNQVQTLAKLYNCSEQKILETSYSKWI